MAEPTDRPLPLDMTDRDVERVMQYLDGKENHEREIHQRLLIEILDCLRRIDDKLEKLSIRPGGKGA
jgi:hypothetical protein